MLYNLPMGIEKENDGTGRVWLSGPDLDAHLNKRPRQRGIERPRPLHEEPKEEGTTHLENPTHYELVNFYVNGGPAPTRKHIAVRHRSTGRGTRGKRK